MNYIDIIISILLLLAVYKGFKNGLIKEIISLISLVAGIYIAVNFSFYVEKHLSKSLSKYDEFVSIISFVLVFLIVFLSLKLAGVIMSKLAHSLQLGLLNKTLGLLFGLSKALLIISIVLFEITHLSETLGNILPKKQVKNSVLYKPVYDITPTLSPIAKKKLGWSKNLKESIKKTTKEVKELITE